MARTRRLSRTLSNAWVIRIVGGTAAGLLAGFGANALFGQHATGVASGLTAPKHALTVLSTPGRVTIGTAASVLFEVQDAGAQDDVQFQSFTPGGDTYADSGAKADADGNASVYVAFPQPATAPRSSQARTSSSPSTASRARPPRPTSRWSADNPGRPSCSAQTGLWTRGGVHPSRRASRPPNACPGPPDAEGGTGGRAEGCRPAVRWSAQRARTGAAWAAPPSAAILSGSGAVGPTTAS